MSTPPSNDIKTSKLSSFLKSDGSGVIYFIIILLASHFFWKFFVVGDESGDFVKFFGLDITYPFVVMAEHIAELTHKALNLLGYDTMLQSNNVIRHTTGSRSSVCVIWGCSGIKQAYIFFCIIAFYKGPWKHKLWYIPTGLVLMYLFNNFRIIFITAIVEKHPNQFDLWHEYILKYAFYGMIFLLWVVWNEKFVTKKASNKKQ